MYKLKKIFKNEKGQGMVEYGLILALVSIVAVLGLGTIGGNINDRLEGIADSMSGISEPGKGLGYSDEEIDDLINQGFIPIATAEDLNSVRSTEERIYAAGTEWEDEYTGGLGNKYVQVADIDLSEYDGWTPIGTLVLDENGSIDLAASFTTVFTGTYDGGNYVIKDLEVKGEDKDFQGLFGAIYGATIRNVGLIDNQVTGAGNHIGGLVGATGDSTIENSYSTGSVTGSGMNVGGLVGVNLISTTTISNSYTTGSVTGSGMNVGGLVGLTVESTIENSYSTGSVEGSGRVGGIVGYADTSTIDNSYATGSVTNTEESVGGLVGVADYSTIKNSYATGPVEGSSKVGGLVGWTYSNTIENSYTTGSVKGSASQVGGLVGYADSYAEIINSYATGSVTGASEVGGLVGLTAGSTITNSYWNIDTAGQLSSVGGGVGKSTDEMKQQTTYEGWDFDTTWKINEGEYPKLR